MNFNLGGGGTLNIQLSFFLLYYIHTEEEYGCIFQQIKGAQIYYANFISIDHFCYHLYSNIVLFFTEKDFFLKC